MRRKRIRLFPVIVLALAAGVIGRTDAYPKDGSPGTAPNRARVTMEALEVRGYEQVPAKRFLPPVPDLFYRSPVRFDLLREDLEAPISPSEVRNEPRQTGGSIVNDP